MPIGCCMPMLPIGPGMPAMGPLPMDPASGIIGTCFDGCREPNVSKSLFDDGLLFTNTDTGVAEEEAGLFDDKPKRSFSPNDAATLTGTDALKSLESSESNLSSVSDGRLAASSAARADEGVLMEYGDSFDGNSSEILEIFANICPFSFKGTTPFSSVVSIHTFILFAPVLICVIKRK